jgi:hypothetical protein
MAIVASHEFHRNYRVSCGPQAEARQIVGMERCQRNGGERAGISVREKGHYNQES